MPPTPPRVISPDAANGDHGARLSLGAIAIASWGIIGVLVLLAQALYRLTPFALEPLERHMLSGWQLALYVGWSLFNAYAEGYRGFQRSFSPRVVARAMHLARHPRPLHVVLAPLYCMAFFHARRKTVIVAWVLFALIVVVVAFVRRLDQPWRGIIDAGVVVGLLWGSLSIVVLFIAALAGRPTSADASLPDEGPRREPATS
jgi:hypothetical protein